MEENGAPNGSGSRQNGPSGPEIRLESTRGEPGRRGTARRGSGGTMDHPIEPLGGGSIKNRQGEGQSASQNGLARKSAGGGAQVAPPADRLVLYSRARSSWKSVHSSESNELPASREQRDDRERGQTSRSRYRAHSAESGSSDET